VSDTPLGDALADAGKGKKGKHGELDIDLKPGENPEADITLSGHIGSHVEAGVTLTVKKHQKPGVEGNVKVKW
jgi:hypothetical protein